MADHGRLEIGLSEAVLRLRSHPALPQLCFTPNASWQLALEAGAVVYLDK